MIKTVTYFEYQALKVIGKKITVLRANDNTATLVQRFFDAHILSRLFLTSIFPVKCFGC